MKIVYDTDLMRPGCPILQAVLGGDPGVAHRFRPETEPTAGLKAYLVNESQLSELVRKSKEEL